MTGPSRTPARTRSTLRTTYQAPPSRRQRTTADLTPPKGPWPATPPPRGLLHLLHLPDDPGDEHRGGRLGRCGFGVDAECGETHGQVVDPGWGCSVVWKGDACFAAPQCIAERGAQMPGHHPISRQLTAGELLVV